MTGRDARQGTLFELPPPQLEAAEVRPEHVALASRLPETIRLGGMTWSFPGWIGTVYGATASERQLASHGLTAYAKHPLLRSVEIDRTYYEPLSDEALRSYAQQVPDDFRFFVKAHEDCCVLGFPMHARYGQRRGKHNPRFLDPEYATSAVVEPIVEGLGGKLGGILFQFPPLDLGTPKAFTDRLHAFLRGLPAGVPYAVELRNPALLTAAYGDALADAGAVHCHNAWGAMPSVLRQARTIAPAARRPLVIRWLMQPGDRYEDAEKRYAPFHRIVDEDPVTRAGVADLVVKAHQHGVPALILVDNKAEGSAPPSIALLAQAIAERLARPA
jgi:uncharacterized protein YecE (DUF72 family)